MAVLKISDRDVTSDKVDKLIKIFNQPQFVYSHANPQSSSTKGFIVDCFY
jgi:hypothetical protein